MLLGLWLRASECAAEAGWVPVQQRGEAARVVAQARVGAGKEIPPMSAPHIAHMSRCPHIRTRACAGQEGCGTRGWGGRQRRPRSAGAKRGREVDHPAPAVETVVLERDVINLQPALLDRDRVCRSAQGESVDDRVRLEGDGGGHSHIDHDIVQELTSATIRIEFSQSCVRFALCDEQK
eukprot:3779029-Rhodomonas_salina.3